MESTEFTRIAGLFEELKSIAMASSFGSGLVPVWDGSVIGKPRQHTLEKMGLVECCHGYYFPTKEGMILYKMFFPT